MAVARADRQLIERRLTILKLASLSEHAEYELNYLHEPAPALRATQRIKLSRFLPPEIRAPFDATNTQFTDLTIQAFT
jgi:hypothetical protein